MRNGADQRLLTTLQLHAADQLDSTNFNKLRNNFTKQMSNHGKAFFRVPKEKNWSIDVARSAGPENDLTVEVCQ